MPPLQANIHWLMQESVISPWLVLFAAAATYTCGFTVISPFEHQPRRIFCPGVATNVYNVWEDESGIFPCMRCRGFNRHQDLEIKRRRNQGLYFSDTSRLTAEVFKNVECKRCPLKPEETSRHYRNLFEGVEPTNSRPPGMRDMGECSLHECWQSITALEVETALYCMKTASASGPDKITMRSIRAFDPLFLGMTMLFNLVIQQGGSPQFWNESKTILLPKSSASQQKFRSLSGWRPITVSSILMRVLHRILLRRLREVCSLEEGQTAFDQSACMANLLTYTSHKVVIKFPVEGVHIIKLLQSSSHLSQIPFKR